MQRLILVYNPRSSRFSDVQKNVLDRTHDLKGFTIGKYEIAPTNLDDNTTKLSKILRNGDLLLSAGGDATGVICTNAIIKSEKDVILSVLPYGNFNDLARTLGTKTFDDVFSRREQKLYPLEIIVDGKFFRYATCYVTIGMTAAAVKLYDTPKMRAKLKTNFGRKISSYTELASWYFKNRHKQVFLPEFKLNGKKTHPKTSDYAAVNGRSMARVMKGGEDYLDPTHFRSETDRLTSFYRLAKLMSRSIFSRVPGSVTTGDVLEFEKPATFTLQAEGESKDFKDVKKIEIIKGAKCLKVIAN
ncbi:hypothetical protein IKF92_01955 [Candidatus Saccharibacteria bacterium]|nr:hypothetical protein [Candidatus Saccharibacteria bacterium]